MRARFSTILVYAIVACVAAASSLAADTVYLTNGRTLENVTTELTTTQIRIRMSGGEMRLPRSQVLRVEEIETSYERYLASLSALRDDPSTTPEGWLALARWALVNELEGEAEESAKIAAQLAPRLEGLAPLMRSLGFALDESSQSWLTREETMRRQGLVRHRGEWTTPARKVARINAESELRQESRRAAAAALREWRQHEEEVAAAVRLREATIQREVAQRVEASVPYRGAFSYSVPGPILFLGRSSFGGFGRHHRPTPLRPSSGAQRGRFEPTPGPVLNIFERAPGSLIPTRAHF